MAHTELLDGYSIVSHGGIGDEHGNSKNRTIPKHNLSGSCHELQVFFGKEVFRILVDMGAYQGKGELIRNLQAVSQGVSTIIFTHPHMDHIGEYPSIFREGGDFEGDVYSTKATQLAMKVALTDSANIMSRDYEAKMRGYIRTLEEVAQALYTLKTTNQPGVKQIKRERRSGNRMEQTGTIPNHKQDIADAQAVLEKYGITTDMGSKYKEHMKQFEPQKPLYGLEEVAIALSKVENHEIKDSWKEIIPGKVAFRFYNAGHIIGSVSVLFKIMQNRQNRYVLFSGDLGSYKWNLHPTGLAIPPQKLPIETVVIESTYGNKIRSNFDIGLQEFEMEVIQDILKYDQLVLTTFSMDRAQIMLYLLIKMKHEGKIDADIILDSPAAIEHTMNYAQIIKKPDDTIFMEHPESIARLLRDNFQANEVAALKDFSEYIDPANGHYIIVNKKNKEEVASSLRPKIIITSSGMAEGGKVISYLEKHINNPNHVFYFPGYLVPGTLGHSLANDQQPGGQQKIVEIDGKEYEVKARMKQFNFLSGHGDAEDLRAWLGAMNLRKGSNIIVVHGDVTGSSIEFAHGLERTGMSEDKNVIVPRIGEVNHFPVKKRKR